MKHTIKLALASLALAAVLAGYPQLSVSANTEEQPATQELILQDGTKVIVDGESVYVVEADGSTSPAPDGTHQAKDGSTITTKDGKVVK